MAWEWVAPVAAASIGIAAVVAGAVVTYKAGGRQVEGAVVIAQAERQQRRLEAAYLELLEYLSQVNLWSYKVYPMWTNTKEEYTAPPVPELANIPHFDALLTAFWSPRVQELITPWREAVDKLASAGADISLARDTESRGQRSGIDQASLQKALPSLRKAIADADRKIRDQVRLELREKDTGDANGK